MEAVIFNRACWVFTIDEVEVCDKIEAYLTLANFSIIGNIDYKFRPQGYTKIWLLGESHFALHTFPEQDALYLELSSCIETKAEMFWEKFEKWLTKHEANYQLLPTHINRAILNNKLPFKT